MVGMNGVATASVAVPRVARLRARRARRGGRRRRAIRRQPQIPIIEHADVRRMLLRQKAIVEGGAVAPGDHRAARRPRRARRRRRAQRARSSCSICSRRWPRASPPSGASSRTRSRVQIHGGYGYSSEYLPEAWLRDQKLNSLHEGTTGIQSLDLLGRKVVADGGARCGSSLDEVRAPRSGARAAGVEARLVRRRRRRAWALRRRLTIEALGARGLGGDVEGMLLHSADYLALFSHRRRRLAVAAAGRRRRRGARRRTRPARLLRGQARAPRTTGSRPSCRAWPCYARAVRVGRGLVRRHAPRVVLTI